MKKSRKYNDQNTTNRKDIRKESIVNKKKIIFYITILIIAIAIIYLCLRSSNYRNTKKTTSENAIEYMEKLGKDFYESYYYPQLSELKKNEMIEEIPTFLENFTSSGISVSLNKIIDLHFQTEREINKVLGKYECDFEETRFVIYPQSPYQKESYRLEPYITCKNIEVELKED